jgi:hypothetical protein
MKKFNVEVETINSYHCFSFEAIDMESALERLKILGLNCHVIRELPEHSKATIRVPEELYPAPNRK